jgi:hypothetical protein
LPRVAELRIVDDHRFHRDTPLHEPDTCATDRIFLDSSLTLDGR